MPALRVSVPIASRFGQASDNTHPVIIIMSLPTGISLHHDSIYRKTFTPNQICLDATLQNVLEHEAECFCFVEPAVPVLRRCLI